MRSVSGSSTGPLSFISDGHPSSITEALLWALNKQKEKERVANGKPAKIQDLSMNSKYEARQIYQASPGEDGETEGPRLGDNAFADLTDRQNDEVSDSSCVCAPTCLLMIGMGTLTVCIHVLEANAFKRLCKPIPNDRCHDRFLSDLLVQLEYFSNFSVIQLLVVAAFCHRISLQKTS